MTDQGARFFTETFSRAGGMILAARTARSSCGLCSLAAPGTHLSRLADLEQVEPVGVPVVDDVGEFPPLLLSAPRHSQIPTNSSQVGERKNLPFSLVDSVLSTQTGF